MNGFNKKFQLKHFRDHEFILYILSHESLNIIIIHYEIILHIPSATANELEPLHHTTTPTPHVQAFISSSRSNSVKLVFIQFNFPSQPYRNGPCCKRDVATSMKIFTVTQPVVMTLLRPRVWTALFFIFFRIRFRFFSSAMPPFFDIQDCGNRSVRSHLCDSSPNKLCALFAKVNRCRGRSICRIKNHN